MRLRIFGFGGVVMDLLSLLVFAWFLLSVGPGDHVDESVSNSFHDFPLSKSNLKNPARRCKGIPFVLPLWVRRLMGDSNSAKLGRTLRILGMNHTPCHAHR